MFHDSESESQLLVPPFSCCTYLNPRILKDRFYIISSASAAMLLIDSVPIAVRFTSMSTQQTINPIHADDFFAFHVGEELLLLL